MAEVLEHLYLTYTGTTKGFDRCLKAGKPLASPITPKQRAAIALVTKLGYFPKGRKAPERSTPKGMPVEKVVADIGPQLVAMDQASPNPRSASARERGCWIIRFWGRSPRSSGGSFTGSTDGIT